MNLIIFKFQSWDKIDIMYRVNFCFLILDLLLTTNDVYFESLFLMQAVWINYYHVIFTWLRFEDSFGSKEEWRTHFSWSALITLIGLPVSYLLIFGIVKTRNFVSRRYFQKNSQVRSDQDHGNYHIIIK